MTQSNALTTTSTSANAIALQAAGPLDQNPAAVYVASLGPGSRRTMREALNCIAEILTGTANALLVNWGALRLQHTAAVRAKLAERYSAATANKMLAALRRTMREAWKLEQMSAEDFRRASDLARIKGETLPAGRALTPGELAALFDVCANDKSTAGVRDAAIIAVLYAGGVRRAEVCALEVSDFDASTGALAVRGKGNKERLVYIELGALAAMADWLHERGNKPGALFCPVSKAGAIEHRALTTQAIYNTLTKRAEQANVCAISPHDFRRTFVSDLLDAGADIATVQKLAGHASVNTTARYDRRGEVAKQKAVRLLHVPYRARAQEVVQNAR